MVVNTLDNQIITQIITQYFQATYHGDSDQLKQIFHPNARISGTINAEFYDWSVSEFSSRVCSKPSAAANNDPYDKNILFIDRTEDVAIIIATVVINGIRFTDYITLLKIENQWLIKNKCFTTS